MRPIPLFAACVLAAVLALPVPAEAANRFSFIRDAEIEQTIRSWAAPLFQVAGLESSAVQIYIVNDRSLNAFVTGGQKLFINTGLLMASEHAGQVIGVIAHETGHIAAGHLARTHEALRDSSAQSILAFVLGAAAAVGTGRGDVGAAIITGGQTASVRNFLQYSRTQEAAADHAALTYLEQTGQSARGFMEFMVVLADQELLSHQRQDPYVRTHPLSRDRIETIRAHVEMSPYSNRPVSPEDALLHARMKAKLQAFLEPLGRTLRRYPETDTSLPARLARAVAHYRKPDLDRALPIIDGLIADFPRDPFLHELRGQMLFENARLAEALPSYREAVRLMPESNLLRRDLGRLQIELDDPALLPEAVEHLRAAVKADRHDAFAWRRLAIAYGRRGLMGDSALALAEEALIIGKFENAVFQAGKAEKLLPRGSSAWLHAQDIRNAAEQAAKRAKRAKTR